MDKAEVQKNLDQLKEIRGDASFFDLHVHPFEVMSAVSQYARSTACPGVFSFGATEYSRQELGDMKLEKTGYGTLDRALRAKVCLLNSRRLYAHTGPRVFGDQMALGGIDGALLLPIMGKDETGDGQLRAMLEMFGGDERFLFGYCVSNDIPNSKVATEVSRVVAEYGVKVLKIHPSITEIDLGSQKGIERVECLLEASKLNRLKVIIHGGLSPDCQNSAAVSYGTVNNLKKVDWSITPETVVIAHGGCFGLSFEGARENAVPVMEELLERYANLAVDTSEIGYETLCLVLNRFDLKKVFFGSDALYEKQWVALVRLWCALKQARCAPEEDLLRIASLNPANLFDRKMASRQDRALRWA